MSSFISLKVASNPGSSGAAHIIWWRAVRKKDSIETLCSLDGQKFMSVRQGYFVPGGKVRVGIMYDAGSLGHG